MSVELRIFGRVREIPANDWNALLGPGASPFVEHAWLDCLEEAGCVGEDTGWYPHHLALYEDNELVAAAPAYVKTNCEGEFVFDWSWAELYARANVEYFPKLVVAVPFTPATGARALVSPSRDRARMIRLLAQGIDELARELSLSGAHVLFPNEAEAELWKQAGYSIRHGVQYHWSNHGYRSFEDFLATLPQKKRTQLRRERKQLELDGLTVTTLQPGELMGVQGRALATTMHALYASTVDRYMYGKPYLNEAFFDLVRERFTDRLAWTVARDAEGEIVAAAFNVRKDDILYGRYWGTRIERPFLHFNVCYYHGLDEAIRHGLGTFNPGAGGEHKRLRGFVPTRTFSAHKLCDSRFRPIIDAFLERERVHIAAYIASGGET